MKTKQKFLALIFYCFFSSIIVFQNSCKKDEENKGYEPVTAFTSNKTIITEGETISFTDQSTNSPTIWSWNFGDGGISTQQNPAHTYNSTGTYTISLNTTNDYGSDTETKINYINVNPENISYSTLWFDNFNSYQLNILPSNWEASGNGDDSYVTNDDYSSYPYSFSIQGISGGNWEGINYREYDNSYQHYQFEFEYLFTGEGQVGNHNCFGSFGIKSNTSWTSGYGRNFIRFETNNDITCYPSKTVIGGFNANEWIKGKIDYKISESIVELKYYINGQLVHQENDNAINEELQLKYVRLTSGDTRCLFDNIKVKYSTQ